jgi:hypothetical protein
LAADRRDGRERRLRLRQRRSAQHGRLQQRLQQHELRPVAGARPGAPAVQLGPAEDCAVQRPGGVRDLERRHQLAPLEHVQQRRVPAILHASGAPRRRRRPWPRRAARRAGCCPPDLRPALFYFCGPGTKQCISGGCSPAGATRRPSLRAVYGRSLFRRATERCPHLAGQILGLDHGGGSMPES